MFNGGCRGGGGGGGGASDFLWLVSDLFMQSSVLCLVMDWKRAFIGDLGQQVVTRGQESDRFPIRSGMPQGSVIRQILFLIYIIDLQNPVHVAQSVTCMAGDTCLTAGPVIAISIPVWSHTFVEIDNEISSMTILLPSAESEGLL